MASEETTLTENLNVTTDSAAIRHPLESGDSHCFFTPRICATFLCISIVLNVILSISLGLSLSKENNAIELPCNLTGLTNFTAIPTKSGTSCAFSHQAITAALSGENCAEGTKYKVPTSG